MHEATFRLSGSTSYDAITDEFEAHISLWCNDHSDLLLVECAPDRLEALLERIDSFAGIDDAIVDGETAVVVTETCVKSHDTSAVDADLDDAGCLLLPPIRYHDGNRSIRVLALDGEQLTRFYHALLENFEVSVESKRDLSLARFDRDRTPDGIREPFPTLSRRQRQVFSTAYKLGYYEVPRGTSMETVASAVGIDRRTADGHRRQAERKLLGAIAGQYLG